MKPISLRGKPAAMPLICAPLVGADLDALLAEAGAAHAARADIVEWRVDYFGQIADAASVIDAGRALRRAHPDMPLLFTRRSQREGGRPVALSERQVAELCAEVCAAGFADLIDFEMASAAVDMKTVRDAARRHRVGLVCSYHDFERTAPLNDLVAHFRHAQELGGDVGKVSVMARTVEDALTLLAATSQAAKSLQIALIGVSMGPHGAISRIAGFAYGSALTFGVATRGSAPGQMPIGELRTAIEVARKALAMR